MTGVVKFFNDEKGFGFITQDNGGPDLFVHRNEVNGGALVDGDAVTFTEAYDDRSGKQKAMNVSGGSGGEGTSGGDGRGLAGGPSSGGSGGDATAEEKAVAERLTKAVEAINASPSMLLVRQRSSDRGGVAAGGGTGVGDEENAQPSVHLDEMVKHDIAKLQAEIKELEQKQAQHDDGLCPPCCRKRWPAQVAPKTAQGSPPPAGEMASAPQTGVPLRSAKSRKITKSAPVSAKVAPAYDEGEPPASSSASQPTPNLLAGLLAEEDADAGPPAARAPEGYRSRVEPGRRNRVAPE